MELLITKYCNFTPFVPLLVVLLPKPHFLKPFLKKVRIIASYSHKYFTSKKKETEWLEFWIRDMRTIGATVVPSGFKHSQESPLPFFSKDVINSESTWWFSVGVSLLKEGRNRTAGEVVFLEEHRAKTGVWRDIINSKMGLRCVEKYLSLKIEYVCLYFLNKED